jgi:lysozyme
VSEALATALALIKPSEGCYLSPYLCPAGVPTIGYGSTHYEDGTAVVLHDPPISRERAESLLLHTVVTTYLPVTVNLCPTLDTTNRVAALVDFTYNLGTGKLRASTLRRRILAQAWDEVPAELSKWVYGGGKRLPGLVRRRAAEAQLI